ncbi:basic 7s globulin [Phtheirospermum japonicum]|uniref:Basic 7s globulin n=1 Tax=Phtheirospermum japonicum TaxID=374723 RepID=A0A830CS37_9LAMI|nr:basic 7s globulin [Phtheirospermum japonicum]
MSMKLTILFLSLLSPFIKTTSPAFLAPITKDLSTQKHLLSIYLNTPPQPTNLLLDLGASFTLVDCLQTYKTSASYGSHTTLTRKPPLTGQPMTSSLSMPVTEGFNPGQLGSIPGFHFSCNKRSSLKGLVRSAAGFAGLGRSNLSIPAQVSNFSSESLVFALCMSGSPSAPGVAFFGSSGPYYFIPEIDLSKYLNYTPLLINPDGSSTVKSYSNPSNEYFIGLTSVKVNGKAIDFDRTLLSIDEKGFGGTKLSTVTPYTVLHSSIFKALTEAFVNESAALNLTVTEPVKPFQVCYKADDVTSSRVGPDFPTVDFVMQDDDVFWRIFGSNSMVRIYREGIDVWCLGFLDGGAHPTTSIVIGGHQMEDNLLQFDLESGRLGFSSSVLVHGTMCANFNFTTNNNLIR